MRHLRGLIYRWGWRPSPESIWFSPSLSLIYASRAAWKACAPMPCPSFEDTTIDVAGVCVCHDLAPGQLYAPGCVVHDPAEIEA